MHGRSEAAQAAPDGFFDESRRRRLVRLCASISGAPEIAEDLAQETLLEAWRNQHKLHDPAGADRWLAAIARNVCRRWARRHGKETASVVPLRTDHDVVDTVDLQAGVEQAELLDLLDRALALLPPQTRHVLISRYVDKSPHAQIAGQLGVSAEAVAMRASRGRSALRQLVEPQLREQPAVLSLHGDAGGGWRSTRVWCAVCGTCALLIQADPRAETVSFRCPGCDDDPAHVSHEYNLTNPFFARLLGDLTKPTAMLARAADWSWSYFQAGIERGTVDCTRCGRSVVLEQYRPADAGGEEACRRGVAAACEACGEQVCSSARGMALATPRVRDFLRAHPRARVLSREQPVGDAGSTVVIGMADRDAGASADVVLASDTLRVLDVRVATSA